MVIFRAKYGNLAKYGVHNFGTLTVFKLTLVSQKLIYAGLNEIFENGPRLAIGRGLCEIDRVQFGVTQKNFKNLGSPSMAELNRYSSNGKI